MEKRKGVPLRCHKRRHISGATLIREGAVLDFNRCTLAFENISIDHQVLDFDSRIRISMVKHYLVNEILKKHFAD